MKKLITLLFIYSSLVFANATQDRKSYENNNLVIIQKVTEKRKRFIIRRGQKDKVYVGQKSLFTTTNTSFVSQAITVNREFSLWEIIDTNSRVPFNAGDIVNISYSVEKVWHQIPRLLGDKTYNDILKLEGKIIQKDTISHLDGIFSFLAGTNQGVSESTSESTNNDGRRDGFHFKANYAIPLANAFRFNLGLRYDSDNLQLTTPAVDVDNQRYMATIGMTVRFPDIWLLKPVPYATLTAGYGKSQSQINDAVKTGTAMLAPSFTIGLEVPYTDKTSFILEAGIEAISLNESFADDSAQKTNITATMISVGMEFL